jgi:hypothetical protein
VLKAILPGKGKVCAVVLEKPTLLEVDEFRDIAIAEAEAEYSILRLLVIKPIGNIEYLF